LLASSDLTAVLRPILIYAFALALATAGLNWLEYRFLAKAFSAQIYLALVAVGFVALGIWVGHRLTPRSPAKTPFARNEAAIKSLGLTPREVEILEALASGLSNKEIARQFGISPHTVKTHVAHSYQKLGVDRRMQAVEKARFLALIA
jgi:DNA-binding CsgD family transcriptional regulator